MKKWILFLDDERMPPHWMTRKGNYTFLAKTVQEAQSFISIFGLPYIISLDHDLGESEPTGQDFVKWLIEQDLDKALDLRRVEKFYIHSQNPVGATNMLRTWESYMKHKDNELYE